MGMPAALLLMEDQRTLPWLPQAVSAIVTGNAAYFYEQAGLLTADVSAVPAPPPPPRPGCDRRKLTAATP